MYKKFEKGA